MSLSTDRNSEIVLNSAPPAMLFPVFGTSAKAERRELRLSYPSYVPGKRQEVDEEFIAVYRFNQAASSHYVDQYDLSSNYMRFLMGDAEFAVSPAGLVVANRRGEWIESHTVPRYFKDGIYPVRN